MSARGRKDLLVEEEGKDITHAYLGHATESASKIDPSHKKEMGEIPLRYMYHW
jgi:hypothetical protein